jgi:hypothetical protein
MKVTIDLNLTNAEEADLRRIIGQETAKNWPAGFAPFAAAGAEEYARLFLGQKVFTRGSDVREYRLFLLIRTALGKEIPDEQTVCALFQTTLSQSRALLRAVMSKYQYELSKEISGSLRKIVNAAKKLEGKDTWIIKVNNENGIAELNKILARQPGQDEIARQSGKLGTYELKTAARDFLLKVIPEEAN